MQGPGDASGIRRVGDNVGLELCRRAGSEIGAIIQLRVVYVDVDAPSMHFDVSRAGIEIALKALRAILN